MSTKEHTPGPWNAQVTADYAKVYAGNESQPVAEIATSFGDAFGPRQWADARLIAAAPELLEALRDLLEDRDSHGAICKTDPCATCRARALLRGLK